MSFSSNISHVEEGGDLEEGSTGLGDAWDLKDQCFSLLEAVQEGGEGRLDVEV